jgi:hypothetical protein
MLKERVAMLRRIAGVAIVAAVVLLVGSPLAHAEGTTCANPTVIVPDGRITTSTIGTGATFFFRITSRSGNSYSAEFHNVLGPAVQTPGTLTVYSDAACATPIAPTNTAGVDPADLNGERVAFTATTAQTLFALNNTSGGPITYSFTVSDTTMFSPAWSTNGTYDTFYSFLNTTGGTINGTLTLYNVAGTSVGTASFVISANSTASRNTSAGSLATVRNTTGTAKFVHNGPPGAILAEADVANFNITPTPYIQIVKFMPARESTH